MQEFVHLKQLAFQPPGVCNLSQASTIVHRIERLTGSIAEFPAGHEGSNRCFEFETVDEPRGADPGTPARSGCWPAAAGAQVDAAGTFNQAVIDNLTAAHCHCHCQCLG